MDDFNRISSSSTFVDFIRVKSTNMTLLGAPILKGTAQDQALQHKVDELTRAVDRLSFLHTHDSLVLLKNSLSMPKLLYLLITTDCNENPILTQFDAVQRSELSRSLNVDFNDEQWLQASLPVQSGGLGVL